MPISSVNFGRWLDRLGFKHTEQPTFHQSVTPVSIVQYQDGLVSMNLGPSGIVGAIMPIVAAEFAAIQFLGNSQVEIALLIGVVGSADFAIEIVPSQVAPTPLSGAVAAPVTLTPQLFQPGGDMRTQRGSLAAGLSNDLPSVRVPTAVGVFHRLVKPAGGAITVAARTAGFSWQCCAFFWEHPNENAQ